MMNNVSEYNYLVTLLLIKYFIKIILFLILTIRTNLVINWILVDRESCNAFKQLINESKNTNSTKDKWKIEVFFDIAKDRKIYKIIKQKNNTWGNYESKRIRLNKIIKKEMSLKGE